MALKAFCCCVPLRTGCILLSLLGILTAVSDPLIVHLGGKEPPKWLVTEAWVACGIGLIANCLLMLGTIKKNEPALLLYLIIDAIVIVQASVVNALLVRSIDQADESARFSGFIGMCNSDAICKDATDEVKRNTFEATEGITLILRGITYIVSRAFSVYSWFCVFSFMGELNSQSEEVTSV